MRSHARNMVVGSESTMHGRVRCAEKETKQWVRAPPLLLHTCAPLVETHGLWCRTAPFMTMILSEDPCWILICGNVNAVQTYSSALVTWPCQQYCTMRPPPSCRRIACHNRVWEMEEEQEDLMGEGQREPTYSEWAEANNFLQCFPCIMIRGERTNNTLPQRKGSIQEWHGESDTCMDSIDFLTAVYCLHFLWFISSKIMIYLLEVSMMFSFVSTPRNALVMLRCQCQFFFNF